MLPPPRLRGIYRTDSRARAAYAEAAGIYRILPRAVCLPADAGDLTTLICWAADHQIPLVPRGAGSAMGGGNVGDGVIVDLTGLPARLEVNSTTRTAIAGAGVRLAQLNQAAARHRLRLPPDPSSGSWATVGGMVATNAAGARSVRFGSVRRWVEAFSLHTADGEVVTLRRRSAAVPPTARALVRFESETAPQVRAAAPLIHGRFPRTRKNSSGYALDAFLRSGDSLDLLIGAEGTLGIVTEIEWRLDPIPAHRAGLRIALPSLELLSAAVAAVAPVEPSAVELLDRTFLDLVADAMPDLQDLAADAVLLIELERDNPKELSDSVEEAAAGLRPLARSVDTALSAEAADRLWNIRHAASPIIAGLPEGRRSLQVIEDACVPVERMSEYIRLVRTAAMERGIDLVIFGHAGDGHIHVNLLPEIGRPGWHADVASLLEEVTDAVIRLSGTPSGEHGDGRLRAHTLERVYGIGIVDLFRLVKQSFDPVGIFNPGVILPGTDPPLSQLKVGHEATPLPPDIERSLRNIEVTGGYGRSRLEIAGEERNQEPGTRNQDLGDRT
jgi:FAD/FMN-containing dehydrogenase